MWVPRWRQAPAIGLAVIWMTLSFILYIWLWFGWPYRRDWDFNSACADMGTILLEDTCRYSAAIVHGVVVRRQESVLMPGYSRCIHVWRSSPSRCIKATAQWVRLTSGRMEGSAPWDMIRLMLFSLCI